MEQIVRVYIKKIKIKNMLSLSDKYPSLRFIVALLREIQSGKGSIKFNQPAK
jgi:hypothetical protein